MNTARKELRNLCKQYEARQVAEILKEYPSVKRQVENFANEGGKDLSLSYSHGIMKPKFEKISPKSGLIIVNS